VYPEITQGMRLERKREGERLQEEGCTVEEGTGLQGF